MRRKIRRKKLCLQTIHNTENYQHIISTFFKILTENLLQNLHKYMNCAVTMSLGATTTKNHTRKKQHEQYLWKMNIKKQIKFNQNSFAYEKRFLFMAEIICVQAPFLQLYAIVVKFVSVFVWFPLFVCKKILRILSAFEIIAFAECVQRVHILASHGNENLAIRRPISLIHIFGLSSCGLLFMNNALISKMIFKWKIGKILQYCCCCC